jgi:hypothetical protein
MNLAALLFLASLAVTCCMCLQVSAAAAASSRHALFTRFLHHLLDFLLHACRSVLLLQQQLRQQHLKPS